MANKYVDLSLTSPSGDGSESSPYGQDEWIGAVSANDVIYAKGEHVYTSAITLNDRVFFLKKWEVNNPWRIRSGDLGDVAQDIDFKYADLYDGIIVASTLHCNKLKDCYVNIENKADQWESIYENVSMVCRRSVTATGIETASANIDNGMYWSTIFSNEQKPIVGGPATSGIHNIYTNRISSADFFDTSHDTTSPLSAITYGFSLSADSEYSNSAAPEFSATDLTEFGLGAPNEYIPRWARNRIFYVNVDNTIAEGNGLSAEPYTYAQFVNFFNPSISLLGHVAGLSAIDNDVVYIKGFRDSGYTGYYNDAFLRPSSTISGDFIFKGWDVNETNGSPIFHSTSAFTFIYNTPTPGYLSATFEFKDFIFYNNDIFYLYESNELFHDYFITFKDCLFKLNNFQEYRYHPA